MNYLEQHGGHHEWNGNCIDFWSTWITHGFDGVHVAHLTLSVFFFHVHYCFVCVYFQLLTTWLSFYIDLQFLLSRLGISLMSFVLTTTPRNTAENAEILLRLMLNTNQSINQSINLRFRFSWAIKYSDIFAYIKIVNPRKNFMRRKV